MHLLPPHRSTPVHPYRVRCDTVYSDTVEQGRTPETLPQSMARAAGRVRDPPAEASARAAAMDAQPGRSAVEILPVSAPPPADDAGDAPADEDASPVAAPAAATPEAARAAVTSHWQALHPDVLHLVYQKLHCQDLVTASCVCVGWREAALRVRIRDLLTPPLVPCYLHPDAHIGARDAKGQQQGRWHRGGLPGVVCRYPCRPG